MQADALTAENTGQGAGWYVKYLAVSIPPNPGNFLFCKTKFQELLSYRTNCGTGYKKQISIKMGGLKVALGE